MHHTDIESAIDEVARELTTASTPAGWRTAVMAKIASRPRRSAAWRFVPVWSAAVAVIAIGVALRLDRTPPAAVSLAPHVAEPVATSARSLPSPVNPNRAVDPGRTVRVNSVVRAQADPIDSPANFGLPALPALAPLDPAAAAPIQPEPLVIPQLTVQPMKELAPLTIPALGDIDRRP